MRRTFLSLCLALGAGCASGQTVGVVGEAGLLAWATEVWYSGSAPSGWADARFAQGQPYRVSALLTDAGAAAIVAPETVTHRLRDAAGAVVGVVEPTGEVSSSGVPGFVLTPEQPGVVYLEARYGGEVVDVAPLEVVPGRVVLDDSDDDDPARW